ncbi:MAG: DUF2680 domain-containing protein [Bacillota bacterium]
MKKALIIILVLALSIGAASLALADDNPAATNPFKGKGAQFKNLPQLKITDEQKAQMTALLTQMLELKKQILQQNVADGTITQEQAKLMEERMNARLEAIKSGQWDPSKKPYGMGRGFHRFKQQPQANS